MRRWIILLGHGSRDERWHQPFLALRQRLQASGAGEVAIAHLQFGAPTLQQVLERCREQGGRQALVVPVFISGGGHLLRDVPELVAAAAAAVPEVEVRASGAIGEEPEVQQAMAQACLRLLEGLTRSS